MTEEEAERFLVEFAEHREEFEQHQKDFQQHCNDAEARFLECHEKTQEGLQQLSYDTQDLLNAWHAAEGAVKVSVALGKVFKWLSGFAIVGAMLTWIIEHAGK